MDGSHVRAKRGAGTGSSPVDRRKTGSKDHLICDGRGTPLHVITTAANVNDITQTLDLVDGIPPVAGRPGRPRRRPSPSWLTRRTTRKPCAVSCAAAESCPSFPARAPRISRAWASSATSSSRPSPCSTSSLAVRWER
ncbi:transposase [Streptomyces sp. TRM68367]|uniref:transposase n=1 Tax=Streptomyces sp. TRM68367 TaxID=2758415 RepID=UPI00165BA725|nr:transposase [Streptomyces sp. TRM68367]